MGSALSKVTYKIPACPDAAADPIQSLPLELQLHIFSYVGYQGCLMLAQTSQYYVEVTKLQDHPVADKETFVKQAQTWRKHNLCYLKPSIAWPENPDTYWITNGYACYTCYRVRPFSAFPTKQIRSKQNKADEKEGKPGHKRCCIDCSIKQGLYRDRTVIAILERLWSANDVHPTSRPTGSCMMMMYCDTCKALKDLVKELPNPRRRAVLECPDCNMGLPESRVKFRFENGDKLFCDCKQCDSPIPIKLDDSDSTEKEKYCKFCNQPVCMHCGGKDPETQDWWCGRGCSKEGWSLCRKAGESSWPGRLKLWEIAQEKRASRTMEQQDVFDSCWEKDVDCLSLLAS